MIARTGRGRAAATLGLIEAMAEIAREIRPCSVRALAYQLFNRKLIPSMGKPDTQRVSRLSVIARERGEMPWEWIVDPTRQERRVATWDDPAEYGRAVQASYRRNKWDAQPVHISVWSEKGTVEGTLRPVLDRYEVPFQVLHGWSGATPVWDAAEANLGRAQDTLILYVGDYDPSGLGMSELDLPQRLARYSSDDPSDKSGDGLWVRAQLARSRLEIRRIALTAGDAAALGPATRFPASDKRKDSRYKWFARHYGDWCWELDAMSPNALRERVEGATVAELDRETWDRYVAAERVELEAIAETCRAWTSILGPCRIIVPRQPAPWPVARAGAVAGTSTNGPGARERGWGVADEPLEARASLDEIARGLGVDPDLLHASYARAVAETYGDEVPPPALAWGVVVSLTRQVDALQRLAFGMIHAMNRLSKITCEVAERAEAAGAAVDEAAGRDDPDPDDPFGVRHLRGDD